MKRNKRTFNKKVDNLELKLLMRISFICLLFLLLSGCAVKRSVQSPSFGEELINGPMVGYSTMKEVPVWVQTTGAATVQLSYWPVKDLTGDRIWEVNLSYSEAITTSKNTGFTAKLIADKLEPGVEYRYQVSLNGKGVAEGIFQTQVLWQHRTEPPDFTFSLGSCAYINEEAADRPGSEYGKDYHIFESIHDQDPDFMIWMGDNAYLRETDWNSMTGIWHRYTHSRNVPEMKELMANTHNYAVWDDHDYGPNNSDRSYVLKDSTLKVFNHFWANPGHGIHGQPGITTKFQWADCEFFLLDNRYFRSPNKRTDGVRTILGEQQLNWLIDQLINSNASFKFVVIGGQVLNTAAVYENYATFPRERKRIIEAIQTNNIKNVVFLTGDRHHSEVSVLKEEGYPAIYDITSSPLTAGIHSAADEGNDLRVPGSYVGDRSFGFISIDGERRNRRLTLQFKNSEGDILYDYSINRE